MTRRAGISLGSNLGDRAALLRQAIALLGEIAAPGEPLLEAPTYQTAPLSCPPGSPEFYNTVVEIAWAGTPHGLLEATRGIEQRLGRTRGTQRNAPRTIDLDLLYCGDAEITGDDLTLPHPRLAGRRFVLQPLADIRPDLVLPGHKQCIRDLLQSLTSDEPALAPLE